MSEWASRRSLGWMAANGALNKVANLLLLLALVHLPASLQYPMVTGGTIIVSTLLSYFTPRKPKAKEIGAVALLQGSCFWSYYKSNYGRMLS